MKVHNVPQCNRFLFKYIQILTIRIIYLTGVACEWAWECTVHCTAHSSHFTGL